MGDANASKMSVKKLIVHKRISMVLSWFGVNSNRMERLMNFLKPAFSAFLFFILGMLLVINLVLGIPYFEQTSKIKIKRGSEVVASVSEEVLKEDALVEEQSETGAQAKGTVSPKSSDIKSLLAYYFGDQAENANKVMMCESQGDPTKVGDTHMKLWSYGLFQINRTWHDYTPDELLNAENNVRIASEIYHKGGWGRWTCGRMLALDK